MLERRRRRSTDPLEALNLWFSSTAKKTDVIGFVLSDPTGILVATNMSGELAEEIAAYAPLMARIDGLEDQFGVPVSFCRIETGDRAPLLCVLGEKPRRQAGLRLAVEGVVRILAETRRSYRPTTRRAEVLRAYIA